MLLGIDFGTKQCGLAKSLASIAVPVGGFPTNKITEEIVRIAQTETIEAIVIGLPNHADGKVSKETILMRNFVKSLQLVLPNVEIHEQDERFSSHFAYQSFEEAGVPRSRAPRVDDMAASIILQDYMDSR